MTAMTKYADEFMAQPDLSDAEFDEQVRAPRACARVRALCLRCACVCSNCTSHAWVVGALLDQ